MSAFATGDSAVAYKFTFKVDGIQCPSVIDVSGIKLEVEVIEAMTQSDSGQLIISHMPGQQKGGEITVTRLLTDDKTMTNWIKQVFGGQVTQARHTASVEVLNLAGSAVKTFNFDNVWLKAVETSEFKAGSAERITEKLDMTYTHAEVA
jgi:phage tail-like protein